MWACFWTHFWTPLKNSSGHFFMIFGVPKWVQKGEFISVLGGHGAPWAPKSVFGPESYISRPPKVTPRSDNRLKKGAKVVEKLSTNLARRTARSGLNLNIRCSGFPVISKIMGVAEMGPYNLIWAHIIARKSYMAQNHF